MELDSGLYCQQSASSGTWLMAFSPRLLYLMNSLMVACKNEDAIAMD
jgi:hypothetical protein